MRPPHHLSLLRDTLLPHCARFGRQLLCEPFEQHHSPCVLHKQEAAIVTDRVRSSAHSGAYWVPGSKTSCCACGRGRWCRVRRRGGQKSGVNEAFPTANHNQPPGATAGRFVSASGLITVSVLSHITWECLVGDGCSGAVGIWVGVGLYCCTCFIPKCMCPGAHHGCTESEIEA